MSGVPDFANILGGSTLFGTGAESEDREPHCTDKTASVKIGSYERQRVNVFISSDGNVVQLKKKSAEGAGDMERSTLGYGKTTWRDDETYGININALLDKIEAQRGDPRSSDSHQKGSERHNKTDLWVEKWRPKNFLDLVGNEKTNRRILGWLRQWSPCVFNVALPKPSQKKEVETSEETPFDPLQRPQKKILLIHGPPGIGKTSVTHVVAKQAGFSVAEINASDERAGTLVRDKIHNTLFNHTFNESAVCLVADEIDGSVESGFIRVLIDIINKDAKATQKLILGSQLKSKKKDRKKSAKLLLRPIIAICNNLYAPALEKLKPYCEIVSFRRPSDGSLQERLEHICQAEDINVPLKTLKELMELSQGDVRNCINNLQFLSSNEKQNLSRSAEDSNMLESSSKDYSVSWFRICNQIFRKDPYKDYKSQAQEMSRQVELNGNYDRIVQGCHSLYLLQKYSDNGVNKPATISDWLIFHDLMFKSLFEHNGELLRYCAQVPLAFFNHFSDIANREDLRVQNSDFELRERKKGNLDIVKLLLHKISTISPSRAPFIRQDSLIAEFLPYVDTILSSDLNKSKNLKFKQSMYDTMVGVLDDFELTLQLKYHDGLETRNILGLEPPIENIVLLDHKRLKEVLTKRPGVYNILLAKSEESKARKRHIDQATREKEKNEEIRSKKVKLGTDTMNFFKSQYRLGNESQFTSDKNGGIKGEDTGIKKEENVRIWLRYKEGFSDAVRKNVSWNDLWE